MIQSNIGRGIQFKFITLLSIIKDKLVKSENSVINMNFFKYLYFVIPIVILHNNKTLDTQLYYIIVNVYNFILLINLCDICFKFIIGIY